MGEFEQWGPDRVEELTQLVRRAMPEEDLTADELFTACYDQPGIVLADGRGAVAAGVGVDADGARIVSVRLLAVDTDHRRRGTAGALLAEVEDWATAQGASRVELGGGLPFPLWPAVDATSGLLPLAEARGYASTHPLTAHGVPNTFRSEPPEGVEIRRAVHDEQVAAVVIATASQWPRWSDEVARALEHGTCHVALRSDGVGPDAVLGIGCHSVTRATWVGPFGVRADHRRRGIGHARLGQICRDLMIAEFPIAEVPDVHDDGVTAFLDATGARPVRSYRRMALVLGG